MREGEHTKRKLQKQRDAEVESANKKAQWSGKKMKPPRPRAVHSVKGTAESFDFDVKKMRKMKDRNKLLDMYS